MTLNRRAFSAALVAGAAASLSFARGTSAATSRTKARNVVLVHGLFADGSCWSEVIARLQAAATECVGAGLCGGASAGCG
jgi:hypothetical protein